MGTNVCQLEYLRAKKSQICSAVECKTCSFYIDLEEAQAKYERSVLLSKKRTVKHDT